MGWRTVIVGKNCKLSYKNDYLIIRSEELKMIHLSEINMIIVENCMVSITSYLINELANKKIKIIFCNEKHNPSCEITPYYGSFNTSKKILNQIKWEQDKKDRAWKEIVKYKIHNQAMLLKKLEIEGYITPLGINHKSEFNQFNLSCDLMEIFRPLIDEIVYKNREFAFDKSYKYKLIDVCNRIVNIENKEQYISNAVPIFMTSVFKFLENNEESKILNYEF